MSSSINLPPDSCVTRNVVLRWLPWPPLGKWIISLLRLRTTLNHKYPSPLERGFFSCICAHNYLILFHLCFSSIYVLQWPTYLTNKHLPLWTHMSISLIHPTWKLEIYIDSRSTCLEVIWTNPIRSLLTLLLMANKSWKKKWPLSCILVHGFDDGWMRDTLVYDTSLLLQHELVFVSSVRVLF